MPPKDGGVDLWDLRYENGAPVVIGKVESVETIEIEDDTVFMPKSVRAVVTVLDIIHDGPALRWLLDLPPHKRDERRLKRMKEKARRRKLKNGRTEDPVRGSVPADERGQV